MNRITKAERQTIFKRAEELTKGKKQTSEAMHDTTQNLMNEFGISKDRAYHAAAHGFIYWRHPSRK